LALLFKIYLLSGQKSNTSSQGEECGIDGPRQIGESRAEGRKSGIERECGTNG
jgi:hypothetical protein